MQPTDSQRRVLGKIKAFLEEDGYGIFILKGYAGTGKTTLMLFLVEELRRMGRTYQLMAPTGRAAKVLRDKVGEAFTIHKTIYNYENLQCLKSDAKDSAEKSYHYIFPVCMSVRGEDQPSVAIVDESSMISDKETHQEFFTFGTGKLLTDLLQYTKNVGIQKLLFVGDDAQLPPVKDNHSCALDESYFEELGYHVETAEMTEVVRQAADSGILKLANQLRTTLQVPMKERSTFAMEGNEKDVWELTNDKVFDKYLEMNPQPRLGNSVIVTFSNAQCYENNASIRERMYGENGDVRVGDILLINNNNYHTFGREIFNGDMAQVVAVGKLETISIKVKRGDAEQKVLLEFKHLGLQFPDDPDPIKCLVFYPLLNRRDADLTPWEQQALYIHFVMRARERGLKEGTEEYKKAIKEDLYFNVLKVKYGYSITCHKSQGGEWKRVIVDYAKRVGTSDDMLRWCYTATTRAKEQLYMVNAPKLSPFAKFSCNPITIAKNCPDGFFSGLDVETPFHQEGDQVPVAVKYKCNSIIEALKETPYELQDVRHLPYRERLTVQNGNQHIVVDMCYDKNGFFKPLLESEDTVGKLNKLINEANGMPECDVQYTPSNSVLERLHQRVFSLAEELGIKITSIVESGPYKIEYRMVTDARFAAIIFYINEKGFVTTAMPRSEIGDQDGKLKLLLESLV